MVRKLMSVNNKKYDLLTSSTIYLAIRRVQTITAEAGATHWLPVVQILMTSLQRQSTVKMKLGTDEEIWVDVTTLTNSPPITMFVVILLFMLVWLLKARQEYGPLCSLLTLISSNNGPVVFTSAPLTTHWSTAGGLDCAEQSIVRLDPGEKEVVFCPFTVRAMLSGPSEKMRGNLELS